MRGQVSSDLEHPEIEVALLAAGTAEPLSMVSTDERSMFTFDLTSGTYDMRIRVGDDVIVLEDVQVG
jgi:hypothetical protein